MSKIVRVNFTYALPGGMWTERENGERQWESSQSLVAEFGTDEVMRLRHIAEGNGFTGIWYKVER